MIIAVWAWVKPMPSTRIEPVIAPVMSGVGLTQPLKIPCY